MFKSNKSILNEVDWITCILFIGIPALFSYYLFFFDPQIQFPLHIESSENTSGRMLIELSVEPKKPDPGPIILVRTVFSSAPGFDWYLGCFEDMTTFNPPADENQALTMYLDTQDESYAIGKKGNATCIPIRAGEKISAVVSFHGQIVTLKYGQTIAVQLIPRISSRVEPWSAFSKSALFFLAWNTVILLCYEILKKIHKKKNKKRHES